MYVRLIKGIYCVQICHFGEEWYQFSCPAETHKHRVALVVKALQLTGFSPKHFTLLNSDVVCLSRECTAVAWVDEQLYMMLL